MHRSRDSVDDCNSELKDLRATLREAKKRLSKCILDSSWTLTVPAVLLSIPASIRFKSYSPFVFAVVSASGFDYYLGMSKCLEFRQNMKDIQLRIAEIENPGFQHSGRTS